MLLLALVVALMILASDFLIPLTVSIFFAFLLMPVSDGLMKLKVPRALSVLISIFLAIAVFGGLIYFFYMQFESFADDWPALKQQAINKWNTIQDFVAREFHITRREQSKWLDKKIEETAQSGDIFALGIFAATGSLVANLVLIPIYVFFLTIYKDKFRAFVLLITKDQDPEKTMNMLRKISIVSQKYLKGIMLDVLILTVLNSTGFLILDLDHAILFGLLASILNIIPYIGVLIGSILPVTMALLTKDELGYAAGVAGVTIVVQFLDNNFITPYVVGSSVSINPLTAVIALVIGSMIWGMAGMILCMPLTGMIKVVCDHVEPLKPYGFILGEERNYAARKSKHSELLRKIQGKR